MPCVGDPGNEGKECCDGCDDSIIISRDGAVNRETVKRWKSFASVIKVDLVRMAQNVLRYNVVIIGKYFNKRSWVSEAWKREHPDDVEEENDGPPERMLTTEERRKHLNIEMVQESGVCAVLGHATSTRRSVDVRLKGQLNQQEERTNQPT